MKRFIRQLLRNTEVTQDFVDLKRQVTKKLGLSRIPKNSSLRQSYLKMTAQGEIKKDPRLEKLLRLNPIRTQSGVAPVAVLTKPYPCPGECTYCPNQEGVPKSYLTDEPAVDRAMIYCYDPYLQVQGRIRALEATGHSTGKIDLIIIGGTFLAYPKNYQEWFIKRCLQASNKSTNYPLPTHPLQNEKEQTLEQAKIQNELAPHRLIGVSIETRPDSVSVGEIQRIRHLGVTKIELGVQSLDDKILKNVKRGHTVAETIRATKLLKNAGLKVCYHLMPNLPGATLESDLKIFRTLFDDQRFQPDMLKIYPCAVIKSSPLYQEWKEGKYQSYNDKDLTELLINIKTNLPEYVRVNRLIRDIPAYKIESGTKISNLRQIIQTSMREKGLKCACTRCREIRGHYSDSPLTLKQISYPASDGLEYFLQYVDTQNRLYALLRLRIPSKTDRARPILPELKNATLVRELHVYGQALAIGERSDCSPQHQHLGRQLLQRAEELTRNEGIHRVAVISGPGARGYYRKLGYKLEGEYMIKIVKD